MDAEEKKVRYVVSQIVPYTNQYRIEKNPLNSLIVMWEIGDILIKNKITKPHHIGWKIQELTNGIIKRPIIFRSYKIRIVWPDKAQLIGDCKGIKSVSNVIEMLPFIDPEKGENILPDEELAILKKNMIIMKSDAFNQFLKDYKQKHKEMGVGGTNVRDKIIKSKKYKDIEKSFLVVEKQFYLQIRSSSQKRVLFRQKIPEDVLMSFSKLAQAIASGNQKKVNPVKTNNSDFNLVYNIFYEAAKLKRDDKRARIRRVLQTERIVDIGLLAYAISSEERKDEIDKTKKLQKIISGGGIVCYGNPHP